MMTSYTIHVHEIADTDIKYKYHANFDDYDGAPDSYAALGMGDTHGEAIRDLIEQYVFKDE